MVDSKLGLVYSVARGAVDFEVGCLLTWIGSSGSLTAALPRPYSTVGHRSSSIRR